MTKNDINKIRRVCFNLGIIGRCITNFVILIQLARVKKLWATLACLAFGVELAETAEELTTALRSISIDLGHELVKEEDKTKKDDNIIKFGFVVNK